MRNLFLLLPLLVACTREGEIRDYYFPVRQLTDGLIYQYENTGTLSDEPYEYWYYLGIERDTALFLSATRYELGVTPVQVSTERIRNEGVFLQQLLLYPVLLTGERTRTDAEIIYDRVFPFYTGDGRATGYRIRFPDPDNTDAENYISLNRYYRGDTTLQVLGEQRDAVIFELQGEVSQRDPELGDISPTFTGYEIYAKNLGLVEYQRDLGAGGLQAGKLVRRISMAEYTGQSEE